MVPRRDPLQLLRVSVLTQSRLRNKWVQPEERAGWEPRVEEMYVSGSSLLGQVSRFYSGGYTRNADQLVREMMDQRQHLKW